MNPNDIEVLRVYTGTKPAKPILLKLPTISFEHSGSDPDGQLLHTEEVDLSSFYRGNPVPKVNGLQSVFVNPRIVDKATGLEWQLYYAPWIRIIQSSGLIMTLTPGPGAIDIPFTDDARLKLEFIGSFFGAAVDVTFYIDLSFGNFQTNTYDY